MQITEQRRKHVIDLCFNQHKSYAEIAQIEHISPRDIHAIIKEELARRQNYKDQQQSAEAYRLFSEGKTRVQVAIELNLPASKVSKLYIDYLKLRGLDKLYTIYKETNGKIWPLWKLYKELIKKRRMSIDQAANAVDTDINRLPHMESLYEQVKDQVDKMQRTIQRLANDIIVLELKISILDKTAFSCSQECKRTKQQLQELTDKKDRMEDLIANILNGEGYSKLEHVAKESVKAVLSENKQVISVSFAALMKTLTSNPKMVNMIYKILTANDDQQRKDNNDNAIEYFESNKDSLLNLAQKHYENLVEAMTKNAIDIAASASSFNPTLSLPQSSSTFPNPFDQNDTYRIEESESFHNRKGDIAD